MTEKPEASVLTARRAAQHFRLFRANDAYEHLCILTLLSSLGPLHLMLADASLPRGSDATLASVGTLSQRLEREARTISQLSNSYICTLFDVGRQDETDYLVMEYVEGETLERRLEKGPLPPEQVFRFGVQIAEALSAAHRKGIVHRDLKP